MKLLTFLQLGLIAWGCGDDTQFYISPSQLSKVSMSPGSQRLSVIIANGGEMLYGLSVPTIAQNKKAPLVMALHYAGSSAPYRGDNYMHVLPGPGLANLEAIIVAPDCPGDSWLDKISEEAVMSFIDAAKSEWPVDPDRIVITGYSMGGIGTWYLADKYPDVFYAAIPMASEPVGFLTGKVPHYVIQGSDDELFGTGSIQKAVEILKSKHRVVELVIADGLTHYSAEPYVSYLQHSVPWLADSTLQKSYKKITADAR